MWLQARGEVETVAAHIEQQQQQQQNGGCGGKLVLSMW